MSPRGPLLWLTDRYSRWEKDGALSFIPPDGRFKLLGYDGGSVTALPLHLKAQMSVDDNGGMSP